MKRKILAYTFFIFLISSSFVFAYIIFSQFLSQRVSFSLLFYLIGKLAGLIGFLFLSVLIISGDTARFFDKFFGIDKIIKFQRKFSLFTVIFIALHPIFFILSTKKVLDYIIPKLSSIPLALGILSFYTLVIVMICSLLYKKISYETWQGIHILTYILFFFSFYHAMRTGSDVNNPFIKLIFISMFIGIILGGTYRTYYKIKNRNFKCFVKDIKWETGDIFTIVLKPNKKLDFKPGQFCFLRLNKDKLYARHPFSISNSPDENYLHFTIKITGRFTKAVSQLKKGEEVIVDGPFGIFTIEDEKSDSVFIAGGIGITPFMSMIRNKLRENNNQNILLFYCVKTKEDIVFKDELDNIKEKWFKKVYILSRDKFYDSLCEKGHINRELIEKYIRNINYSVFYICGPELMKISCKKELKTLGVKNKDIITESFFW